MLSTQPAGCLISAWFVSYTITLEASLPQSMAWINPDRDVADNDYGVGFAIAGINCVPLHLSPHHFPMQKVNNRIIANVHADLRSSPYSGDSLATQSAFVSHQNAIGFRLIVYRLWCHGIL